mmetsp:Transcript_902/g.2833  ORF Transcript_902/g.2833 Transcript_902/m.2833 type:complete len:90 (-) Transcript_902:115-384(-)
MVKDQDISAADQMRAEQTVIEFEFDVGADHPEAVLLHRLLSLSLTDPEGLLASGRAVQTDRSVILGKATIENMPTLDPCVHFRNYSSLN